MSAIPFEVLVPIGTFILGYLLKALNDWINKRAKKDLMRKALGMELWAMLLKLDECKKGAYRLKREKLPFVTASYRAFRPEAPAFLEPEIVLQVDETYALIKRLNAFSVRAYLADEDLFPLPSAYVQTLITAINKVIPAFLPTMPELP